MMLLIDADAFSKLAHWGLLQDLPTLTGVTLERCVTLESVIHRSRRAAAGAQDRLFRSPDVAKVAVAALNKMLPPLQPNPTLLSRFQDVTGIDAGEAVLLSILEEEKEALLLTGDKRALRTLAGLPRNARAGFSGRIMAIEQVVLAALNTHGLVWVREHVCAFRDVDKSIAIVLGSRCEAPDAEVRAGLDAYLQELATLCDPSLLTTMLDPEVGDDAEQPVAGKDITQGNGDHDGSGRGA